MPLGLALTILAETAKWQIESQVKNGCHVSKLYAVTICDQQR